MEATISVSLHVRRGDYITDPSVLAFHGTCDAQYYGECMRYIESKIPNPTYFVFSDDLDWAREHIAFRFPVVFVDGNVGKESFEDMRLMSHCQHNIVANSSFSWW
jgi:hypothetical protein